MSAAKIDPAGLRRMLLAAADEIIRQEPRLNALDSAVGDGDHGITMRLGCEAVKMRLGELDDAAGFDTILQESGLAFLGVTGGAIGVILAKMLMGAGHAMSATAAMGAPEVKTMLEAMENAIARAGKAKPGDKTILDAVHAAAGAVDINASASEALFQAAAAAKNAADETANMVCRIGRGSKLGDRTLGHPDPGAVSCSIILRAFADAAA
jgi:dihydroxyacetone kinase phosphoprotein-dependent L subunit